MIRKREEGFGASSAKRRVKSVVGTRKASRSIGEFHVACWLTNQWHNWGQKTSGGRIIRWTRVTFGIQEGK